MAQSYDEKVTEYKATREGMAAALRNDLPTPRRLEQQEIDFANGFMSQNVATLSDEVLMRYFHLFVGLHDYAGWELAASSADLEAATEVYNFTVATVKLQAPDGMKPSQADAWVKTRMEIQRLNQERLNQRARHELLKALTKGYEEKSKLCSREMTRRLSAANINSTKLGVT